jgi:hypothetical protein
MLPADRPDHEVGWPRAVQTGIAILGACAFGAVALSYGYGYGGGGRTESYPQAAIVADTAVVVFWCDWRNATDSLETSANAATCVNAGAWNRGAVTSNWDNAFVVDSAVTDLSGRGWPSQKAFRLRNNDGDVSGGAAQVQVKGDSAGLWPLWDTLEVGESQYHRVYYMVDINDTITESNHVLETRDGIDNTGHHIHYVDATTDSTGWNFYARLGNPAVSYNFEPRDGSGNDHVLPKDTTVMVETQIRRTHADSATLHARVYVWNGSAMVLRYDDNDFYGFSAASGQLSDSTNYYFPEFSAITRYRYPLNGWGGGTGGWIGDGWFTGAVSVCRVDWCGEYPIAGVEN